MSTEIPSWGIAVASIFASIIIIFSTLFLIRRRLIKRGIIGIDHQEKNIASSQVTLNRSLSTFTSPPASPYTFASSRTPDEKKCYFQCSTPTLVTPTASAAAIVNQNNGKDENDQKSPPPPMEVTVTTTTTTTTYQTLPPPSSSFFSDKMELDSDEAQALYNAYVNGVPKNSGTSAAQNIQQRAAALSTNLTKSIRRRSMANLPTSIVQFFEKNDINSNSSNSNSNSSSSSLENINNENSKPSPSFNSSKRTGTNTTLQTSAAESSFIEITKSTNNTSLSRISLAKDLDDAHSTKIMIDDDDDNNNDATQAYFNIPFSPSSPAPLCFSASPADINNNYNGDDDDDGNETQEKFKEEDAAAAARKAIQSASRKSRTRSMIIADETAQAMFALIANTETVPTPPLSHTISKTNFDKRRYSIGLGNNNLTIQNSTAESSTPHPHSMTISDSSATAGNDYGHDKNNTIVNNNRRHSIMMDDIISNRTSFLSTSTNESAIRITHHDTPSPQGETIQPTDNMTTIRKMLQSSWSGNNLKESSSSGSLASERTHHLGSIRSNLHVATGSSRQHPLLQVETEEPYRRPSMPAGFMSSQGDSGEPVHFSHLLASRPTEPPHP